MTWTLDRTTDTGKVRVLITGESVEASAVFADEDIEVLLDIEGSVLCAAALGLERIAGDSALLLRKVRDADPSADVMFGGASRLKVGSIELDGTANAATFLSLAARYRAAAEGAGGEDIYIAPMVVDERSWAETYWSDVLRTTEP